MKKRTEKRGEDCNCNSYSSSDSDNDVEDDGDVMGGKTQKIKTRDKACSRIFILKIAVQGGFV